MVPSACPRRGRARPAVTEVAAGGRDSRTAVGDDRRPGEHEHRFGQDPESPEMVPLIVTS